MIKIGILANIFKKKDKNKQPSSGTNILTITSNKVDGKSQNAYDNYLVRKTVNKIADLVASTPIRHYSNDISGNVVEDTQSNLSWVLNHQANDRLTSYLFFKQMINLMLINNDSFAWIHRDSFTGEIIELIPIVTNRYTLITPKEFPDRLYVDFTLKDGLIKRLPLEELIHFVGDFSNGEFFGDSNAPLVQVSSINDDLWANLVTWTKDNITIKGFLKTDAILKKEDMEAAKQNFAELLKSNNSAYMTLDGKFNYIPVNEKSSPMDVNYIDKIESTILKFYSTHSAVIEGTATTEQMQSFHKVCLDPIFRMIEQELESKFLSKKEILGWGHKITFVCNNFEHMTPSEKVSAFTLLTNIGVITGNELRQGFGFARVDGLDTYMYSKNFAQTGMTDETGKVGSQNDENESQEIEPTNNEELENEVKEEKEDNAKTNNQEN